MAQRVLVNSFFLFLKSFLFVRYLFIYFCILFMQLPIKLLSYLIMTPFVKTKKLRLVHYPP